MEQALSDGAMGVSLGLGYAPECFYTTEELIRALAPLAGQNIPVTVHMRQEGGGVVETLVDNEIAVQNLTKMAQQKGYLSSSEKLAEQEYRVRFTIKDTPVADTAVPGEEKQQAEAETCIPDARTDTVVVIASDKMGEGAEELGKTLLKAFVFALTQQDQLPKTVLFYNGGASLTCEGSPMLDDLKALEAQGVEIMTCGTCLNFYGLTEKLAVGSVTNMYTIVEKLTQAGNVVKP